jgi:hypothetical protein
MLLAASKSLSLPFIIGANLRHEKEFSHTIHPLTRDGGALGQLLSRYVFLRGAHEQISFSHSIDPSLRCSCTNTTHSVQDKKEARVRDRIHKKFLFWEPNAHSPFQARCLNYSSIRRQGEQFETHKKSF